MENTMNSIRNVENITRNSPKTLQVLPKATQNGDKPAKVSKATPKAAKASKKHSKRHPETNPKPNPEPEILISPKCL